MFDMGKRFICAALTSSLAICGLTACVAQPPKNAKELIERFNANNDHGNYSAETQLSVSMDALGTSGTINYTESANVAGDNAHATITTGLSESDQSKSEMYVEKDKDGKYNTYTSAQIGDTTVWYKLTTDSGLLCKTLIENPALSEANFETTNDGYNLVLSGSTFADTITGTQNSLTNSLGGSLAEGVKSALSGADIVYSYNKNCMLTGITYKVSSNSNDNSQSTEGNETMFSGSIELNAAVKDYGKTDAKVTAIPENVKSEAIDATSLIEDVSKVVQDAPAEENAEGSTQGSGE